jgi:hypothetical protein
MRIAFLARTEGRHAALERLLLLLIERHHVECIVALGEASADVEATLRRRRIRASERPGAHDAEFDDYVLATVLRPELDPLAPTPDPDATRDVTSRLEGVADLADGARWRGELGGRALAAVSGDADADADADIVIRVVDGAAGGTIERDGKRATLDPGRLDPAHDGAAAVLVGLEGGSITATFIDSGGEPLAQERLG